MFFRSKTDIPLSQLGTLRKSKSYDNLKSLEDLPDERLSAIVAKHIRVYLKSIESTNPIYNAMKREGKVRATAYLDTLDYSTPDQELLDRVYIDIRDTSKKSTLNTSELLRDHLRDALLEYFKINNHTIEQRAEQIKANTLCNMSSVPFGYGYVSMDLCLAEAKTDLINEAKNAKPHQVMMSRRK